MADTNTYQVDTFNVQDGLIPYPIAKGVRPEDETVPAVTAYAPNIVRRLPEAFDPISRLLTTRVYEDMLLDPAVSSSFNSLKLGIMSGSMQLISPVKQPAWSKHEATVGGDADAAEEGNEEGGDAAPDDATGGQAGPSPSPDMKLTPEQKKAKDILEFCQRAVKRVLGDVRKSAFELLDAMAFGVALCEPVYGVVETGKDKGKLVWKSLKAKPRRTWSFVVDDYNNVVGILVGAPTSGWQIYPAEKFCWLTWMPRDHDPRGTSQLAAAHLAWNHKTLVWPEYYAHTRRFGSGGLDMEMAEGDENCPKQPLAEDGTPDLTKEPIDAAVYYAGVLAKFANGGILVRPSGSKFTVWEPKNNGEAFLNAFDLFDRQICLAIQYQVRTTMEAKNGSRADSQTAEGTRSLVIEYGRSELAIPFQKLLRDLVRFNFGEDAAEEFTPDVAFGGTEGQDKADRWLAAASIGFSLAPSQLMRMDEELDLPVRDPSDAASVKTTPGVPDPPPKSPPGSKPPEPGRSNPPPAQDTTNPPPKGGKSA